MKYKKGRLLKSVVAATLAVSILSGCASGAEKRFKKLLQSGDMSAAVDYYNENKDKIDSEKLLETIQPIVENYKKAFLDGNQTSSEVTSQLSYLSAINEGGVSQYINEQIDLIYKIEDSQYYFEEAESYYSSGSYEYALDYYGRVIEEDPNYATAQQRKTDCENAYKDELLATAKGYADDEDYERAANYLYDYVDLFTTTTEIKDKADEYHEKYVDKVLDERLEDADTYIANGDYYSAIEEINALEEEFPDNKRLADLKESTGESYLATVLPLIDSAFDAGNYGEAYGLCQNAIEILPDNKELQERKEKIEPLKPTLLSEMKISESDDFEQLTDHKETYTDVVGNRYNPGNLFRMKLYNDGWGGGDNGYAKIYLNAQYTALTGTLVLDDGSDAGSCVLNIYGDDQLLYSGTYSRTTAPQSINVNVTGKQWIEINMAYPEGAESTSYHSNMLLSNFGFTGAGAAAEAPAEETSEPAEEAPAEETSSAS